MATTVQIIIKYSEQGSLKDTTKGLDELNTKARAAGGGMSSFGQIATGALRQVGALGVSVLADLGKSLVGFGADSVKVAGDFEAGMNRFASVTGVSGDQLTKFRDKFLDLGSATQFSAAEAQQAAIELAKGGVAIEDVMGGATDATLALAAAGELELGPAAEIVAKQLGVWQSTGVQAADVADLMAQAANASTVDVDELALGMANVGGIAKAMGLSFEETTRTMAMISPGFSSASDAGTSLKTMLSRLIPTTKDQTAAMIDLGLATEDGQSKFFDASGSFIGMERASALLQSSLAGLSEEQRVASLQAIFGQDAFRAASLIAEQGAPGFLAMGDAMGQAGTAAEQATTRNQGFNFALDSLKGAIETMQIVIGSALLPVMTSFINDVLLPGGDAVLAFAQGILSAENPIAALTAAVDGVLPGFSDFIAFVGQAWTAVQPLVDLVQQNLMPILVGLGGVLGGVIVAAIASAVVAFLSVAAPIAAMVAVGAALYAAWQSNFMGIQDVVTAVLGAVWEVVQAVLGQIQVFWNQNGADIMAFVQQTWSTIQQIIGTALELIRAVVVPMLTGIAQFINTHGSTIQAILTNVWNQIKLVINTALTLIKGIITAALQIVKGDWSGAWETIKQMSATVVQNLYNLFRLGLNNIKLVFTLVWDQIKAYFQGILNGFVGWLIQTLQGLVNALNDFLGKARAAAGGVGQAIVSGIADGISSGAGRIISAAKDAALSALEAAKKALGISSPSAVFAAQVGMPVAQGMAQGITASQPLVMTAAQSMGQAAVREAQAVTTNNNVTNVYLNYAGMAQPEGDVTTALRTWQMLYG